MNVNAVTLGLFSGLGGSNSSIQSIDLSGLQTTTTPVQGPLTARDFARMTPWDQRVRAPSLSDLARTSLASTRLLEVGLGSGPGSSVKDPNDKALFTIHNGIRKLQALADAAAQDGVSSATRAQLQSRITKGIAELTEHARNTKLDGALLLSGRRMNSHSTDIANSSVAQYDSKVILSGASGGVPPAFEGDKRFQLNVTKNGVPATLSIDLAGMGTTERTLLNVSSFINQQLFDAGFESRLNAVETKVPPPANASKFLGTQPDRFEQRWRISLGLGEALRFDPTSGDAEPALFVAGAKAIDGKNQSVVAKLTDLTGTTTAPAFETNLSAAGSGTATARAITTGPDGSVYMIADTTGTTNGLTPKSSRDVVMMKYDTTGQLVWSRALGSAAPAEGFSISVGSNGTIAVAGAVDGRADRATSTTGDRRDSFVAAFDAEGRDLWYHQQGAFGNDRASHVRVGDDGQVFVVGQASESYGGSSALGGTDVYLQGFDVSGAVKFTTSIGSAGDDTPAGLILENGAPSVIWNQSGGPQFARFDGQTGANAGGPNLLAATGLGAISSVTHDESGRLFVVGSLAGDSVNNQLIGMDASTNTILFQTSAVSPIRAVTAAGGRVAYATDADVVIPATQTTPETTGRQTRIIGLDAQNGAAVFNRGAPAASNGEVSMALSANASKSLDALGLPQGDLRFGDTSKLTDRTGLRAGDNFLVSVNGRADKKIEIAQGETLRTLAAKINRVLLRDGKTEVRTIKGNETLVITPFSGDRIELKAGAGVSDALKQLGLETAVAIPTPPVRKAGTRSISDPPPVIALEIPTSGDVSDKAKAKATADAFDGVLRRIRIGYREISDDPTQVALRKQIADGQNKKTGSSAAIAYYQQQAANGQDALRKLGVLA